MGARDKHGAHPPWDDEFKVVGKPARKVDGLAKATGEAVYTDDIVLPGMLHAKTLRSPHPHARIKGIDASRALAIPGVHAVITGTDLPIRYGVLPWTQDENALAVDKVRFIGDPVAAVAAVDEDTAEDALLAIDVEYEILEPHYDPVESMQAKAPLIHEDRKSNISKHVLLEFGEVDKALEGADVVLDEVYEFHGTTHAPMEPHCAVARMGADGVLTVWSSTQITHYVHRTLAQVLELPEQMVRVIQPCLGGGFGGKSDPFSFELCVAKLSMVTGRPVKMLYTREEVFYTHRGRHPMHMRFRTGATRDGKLLGVDAKIIIDGGSYSSFGLVTTYYSGQLLAGPYELGALRFDSTRVFTNKPPCGPKRGHGAVQPRFAFEVQLDELCVRLGIDPIEQRRRVALSDHEETLNGQRITSNGFLQCLQAVERASGWIKRRGTLPYGRGLGVAGSSYISGTNYPVYPNEMPQAGIMLKADRSGLITAFTGGNDIGQGSSTVVRMLVAEELGLPLEHVRVVAADTDLCPVDLGAYSSRVTFMVGNATLDACRKLRAQVVAAVAEAWEVEPERVRMAFGSVTDKKDPARQMSVKEAFRVAEVKFDTLGATGSYNTPKLGGEYRGGTIGASPAYSYTAHVAEVSVDVETGRIHCDRIWVAHDCGRAINPTLVAGQMDGSAYMGAAEVVMEHHQVDERGLHLGPSLLDYRIPTSMDVPELSSLIVESVDPEGPYGAKEAGEGPLHPALPAIANAVYDAVGIRLRALPFTPAKVLAALRALEAEKKTAQIGAE